MMAFPVVSVQISRIPGRRPSTRSHAAFIPIAPRPAPSSVSSASSSSSLAADSAAQGVPAKGLMLEDLQYSRQAELGAREVPMTDMAMSMGGSANGAGASTSVSPTNTYLPLCASLGSSPLGSLETPLSVPMSMSMPMSTASGAWAADATPAYADAGPFTLEDMDVDVIGDWTWLSQTV